MERNNQMHTLLLEALRDPRFQHFSLVAKFDKKKGFMGDGNQTPEMVQLMRLHQDFLIKLLRKNLVALYWNQGDDHAEAMAIPVKTTAPATPFENFELKFPPSGPTLVN